MIKILIQEVPFQPELKNEIQQLVETELLSHFKKLIEKFQEKGKLLKCPSYCFTTYFISCIRFIINTIFIIARRKME